MEYIDGVKVTDVSSIKKMGLDIRKVAETTIRAYADQIFSHGFVHCDPHPGCTYY